MLAASLAERSRPSPCMRFQSMEQGVGMVNWSRSSSASIEKPLVRPTRRKRAPLKGIDPRRTERILTSSRRMVMQALGDQSELNPDDVLHFAQVGLGQPTNLIG